LSETCDQGTRLVYRGLNSGQRERGLVSLCAVPNLSDPQCVLVNRVTSHDVAEAAGHGGRAAEHDRQEGLSLTRIRQHLAYQSIHADSLNAHSGRKLDTGSAYRPLIEGRRDSERSHQATVLYHRRVQRRPPTQAASFTDQASYSFELFGSQP